MAKYGKTLAQVVVEINGKQQVQQVLKAMEDSAKKLRGELDQINLELEELAKKGPSPEYDAKNRERKGKETELKQIQRALKETEKLNLDIDKVLQNMSEHSAGALATVRRRIEATLRSIKPVGEKERQAMREMQQDLKKLTDEINRRKGTLLEFEDIMHDLNNVDDASLAKVEQRLKSLLSATNQGDIDRIKQLKEELKQVQDIKDDRTIQKGKEVISQVKAGSFKGTIAETEEAIKRVKEYQRVMKDTSPEKVKEVEDTFKTLNESLARAKSELLSFDDAMKQAGEISNETWDGTQEDLDKLKRSLEYFKKAKLKIEADDKRIRIIDDTLGKIEKKSKQVGYSMNDVKDVIARINTAPIEDLQKAAGFLQQEVLNANRGTVEYLENAARLRQVNTAINQGTKEWKAQENQIIKTGKRLASYVAIYGGYNFIAGKIREVTQANLQLSDSIADIQKTTGLTREEVSALGQDIDKIDTRTTQQNLYQLAAAAGQLGLKSQEDILGFTKASDMITVALNELGTEGVTTLLKIANLTGETSLGVETALKKIGSSINELTANSAATAGPITDFISRVGGVASQASLATYELAALGATADAAGQHMEVSGTSMSKIIAALKNDALGVSQALNIDFTSLDNLIKKGNTMEAIVMVFEAMQRKGGASAAALKALGSEGERMNTFVAAMVQNLDNLKKNLEISNRAYIEATSIENEFNVKNNNAIGILQRLQNTILEVFSNPTMVNFLTGAIDRLKSFTDWFLQSKTAIKLTVAAITQLIGLKLVGFIAGAVKGWKEFVNILKVSFTGLQTFARQLTVVYRATMIANGGIHKLRVALVGLWRVMVKHPIALIATGLTILATRFIDLEDALEGVADAYDQAAQAEANMRVNHQKERDELTNLVNSIEAANKGTKTRGDLISEFNSKYSKYLGYQLDDKAGTEELRLATQLLNAELEKKQQLQMFELRRQSAEQQNTEKTTQALTTFTAMLREAGVPENVIGSTITYVNELVDKGMEYRDIWKEVEEYTGKSFEQWKEGGAAVVATGGLFSGYEVKSSTSVQQDEGASQAEKKLANEQLALYNLVQIRKDYKAEVEQIDQQQAGAVKALDESVFKERKANLNKQFEALQKMTGKEGEELEARKSAYRNFYTTLSGYISTSTGEQQAWFNQIKATFEGVVKKIPELANVLDAYGKSNNLDNWTSWTDTIKNIGTADINSLVEAYKALEDDSKVITADVVKYNQMMGTSFTTQQQAMDDVWNKSRQIKAQLEKYHRNTSGNFLSDSDGSGGKGELRGEFQAALAALEAYYNDREELVRDNALKEGTTEEDLNKRLFTLEKEHLSARIELRELMLGKENDFLTKFNYVATSEFMKGIDYSKLQTQIEKLGKARTQGLEKNLTADMVTLQKMAWEHQEELSKILLENDPVQKAALQYQKSFEKMDMLWAADEQRTKDAAREKMAALLEFSTKRSKLNDEDMRTQLEASQQFEAVVKKMSAEEYQAFLVLLDQYAEAATNAKRLATQKAIKNLEFGFDNSELGKQVSAQLKNLEEMEGQLGDLDSSGLVLEATSLKKHKELVEQNIALEQLKWNTLIETEKNGMNRSDVIQDLILKRDKATYEARLEVMKLIMDMDANMFEESNNRIDQMQGWGAISEIDATERQRSLIYAELELRQMRIEEMIRIEEEGQNRMDVINNLRLAKQNALYKADRRLTELTMQEYQQRAAIANEWGTAIGQGLGEMIVGTEDAGKALVKNLATMAVQSIGQMAQMYVAKQLLLSQQNMSEAAAAMTTATTAAAEATAVGAAKTAEATAIAMATPDSVLTYGATGAAKAAVISGLIAAAVAASIAIINSLFPGAGSKATASNRKLSTGMLTYAEGNYPVLGNDGKVYDAKYEGAGMKTGVYGGGAHFGIFSEKQPEMIVDGKTTQKLILNYPYIYDAITTIAKNGRLVNAMPTFASGDYPAGMQRIAKVESVDVSAGAGNEQMTIMQEELAQSREVNRQLLSILKGGIVAHLDGLETHKTQKRNERFLKRRGID